MTLSLPAGTPPTVRYAEGANYTLDVEGALALCRVRIRRDLTTDEGARLANEKVALFRDPAAGESRAMLLDLSLAPAVIGPKTQEALGKMLAAWHVAGKPFAIVAGSNAMQQLQLRRLAASSADGAAVFEAEAAARDWLRARMG